MIFIIIILIIISIVLILSLAKPLKAILSTCVHLSLLVMIIGLYIYFSKVGGFVESQKVLLLGPSGLTAKLTSIPIRFYLVSELVGIGRILFPYFYFILSVSNNLSFSTIVKKKKWLNILLFLPILILLILTIPNVFESVFAYNFVMQDMIILLVNIVILIYLTLSVVLYVNEYNSIQLSIARHHQRDIMLSRIMLLVTYMFFASFEPMFIAQNYSSININIDFSTVFLNDNTGAWTAIMIISLFATLVNIFQLWKYYKFNYDRSKKEISIKQKVASGSVASSMLIHGLKNQFLTEEILCERMKKEIENVENEEIKTNLNKINLQMVETNDFIIERLNSLYKAFLKVKTVMLVTSSSEVVEKLQHKLRRKNREIEIIYDFDDCLFMADLDLFSEAIYNLVINGIDATEGIELPKIIVSIQQIKQKVVFKIIDNGHGIPDEIYDNIFTPFTTSKNTHTNWGMGLTYTHEIVKKHMGFINFETSTEGTIFTIVLPNYAKEKENEKEN